MDPLDELHRMALLDDKDLFSMHSHLFVVVFSFLIGFDGSVEKDYRDCYPRRFEVG
jgi:hypothetical protein